jgi:hypothetical protein
MPSWWLSFAATALEIGIEDQRTKTATREDRKWPVSWVGMAGFEPAASSSRTSCTAGRLASSQLAEYAAGRRCWPLCGNVAVLPCCTVYRISNSDPKFRLDQRRRRVFPGRPGTASNCNPNCNLASAACSPLIRRTVRTVRRCQRVVSLPSPAECPAPSGPISAT